MGTKGRDKMMRKYSGKSRLRRLGRAPVWWGALAPPREEVSRGQGQKVNDLLMVTKLVNAKARGFMASHSDSRIHDFNDCISFLWLL